MKTVYIESSALLQWLFGQSHAAAARRAVDRADTVLISALTLTETERALVRAENEQLIKGGDARRLRGLVSRAQARWMRMAVTDQVLARAGRPFPVEPVRTLDAIHLATALEFAAVFPDLRVLSFDQRVSRNAEALGIA
jgi:predicted nucleic acid-binding protein